MVISGKEKAFDKFNNLSYKSLEETKYRKNIAQYNQGCTDKSVANIIVSEKN